MQLILLTKVLNLGNLGDETVETFMHGNPAT